MDRELQARAAPHARQAQTRQHALDDFLESHPNLAASKQMRKMAQQTAEESEEDIREVLATIARLGGSARKYAREKKNAVNRMVAEVYSEPRVTAAARVLPSLKLILGFVMDLLTNDEDGNPWDISRKDMRQKCREMLDKEKPMLLVGSPICRPFSSWQRINDKLRDPALLDPGSPSFLYRSSTAFVLPRKWSSARTLMMAASSR